MKKLNMVINALDKKSHINREIYGQFSEHLGTCIYDGLYVGEESDIPNTKGVRNDLLEALKGIRVPVLRWPGGCFAEDYFWKDGVGPKNARPKRINAYWGGVKEDNSFGTHDFFNLCEELGAEPYLALNMASGTVKDMSDWLEYIVFDGDSNMSELREKNGRKEPWKLKYIGIGNENWGAGGGMRPEYYADEFRKYSAYARDLSGNHFEKIACGPNGADYNWTDVVMRGLNEWNASGMALHYYTLPTGDWNHKGSATDFDKAEYYKTIKGAGFMEELVKTHGSIIRRHNKKIKLVVDEWGNWYDVEPGTNPGFLYQQNTMRDAITAAMNLNIFNNNSDIVMMANIAQAINVLQAMALTDGKDMCLTPTYHVFDMFKEHQDAELVYAFVENFAEKIDGEDVPMVSLSASVSKAGKLVVTAANASVDEGAEISATIEGFCGKSVAGKILCDAADAKNTFEDGNRVSPKELSVSLVDGKLAFELPACSVVSVEIG